VAGEERGAEVRGRRLPSRPSKRDVHNRLQGLAALATGSTPVFEQPRAKRASGKQRESYINDAVKEWRKVRPDVTIFRNNVGSYEYAPGKWVRYGLCNGSSDFIGYQSVTVTPGMLGKKVALFLALECKTEDGVLRPDQEAFINAVRDAGGKAGVVRDVGDCEEITKER
jgi:hypothetical protein